MAVDLQGHAEAVLGDVLSSGLDGATGVFPLEVSGRRVTVTVTADEGPFTEGAMVRVLVEHGGAVGYAAGVHGAAPWGPAWAARSF